VKPIKRWARRKKKEKERKKKRNHELLTPLFSTPCLEEKEGKKNAVQGIIQDRWQINHPRRKKKRKKEREKGFLHGLDLVTALTRSNAKGDGKQGWREKKKEKKKKTPGSSLFHDLAPSREGKKKGREEKGGKDG